MVTSAIQLIQPYQCGLPEMRIEHLNFLDVRDSFPILKTHCKTLFFDNAATTQKPLPVLEKLEEFNRRSCANAGRGTYSWSTRLSREIEEARVIVANFLNSESKQVAFTSGATDSLNMIATMWGLENLKDGDEIMLCKADHSSSVLPWFNVQEILRRRGINVKIVPFEIHHTGTYDRKSIETCLSSRTRIVCMSHIHHLYGMEMDLAEVKALVPRHVLISLDASQSASHTKIDSAALAVDFISFSGHKMFAGNGTGVLWTSARALSQLWPMRVGAKTKLDLVPNFAPKPDSLSNLVECGTLNVPGILSMKAAVEFIESHNIERMSAHVSQLTVYLLNKLKRIPSLEFAPGIGICECTKGFGIISFKINDVNSADIGAYLDSEDIFVKTGDQCVAQTPNADEYIRVSLHIYNTLSEVDRFAEVLREAIAR